MNTGPSPGRRASLVVQTAFLGDMVLTTPLIAELAKQGPVDVVGTPANVSLLANNPDVRHVIAYDKRGAGRVRGMLAIARDLRREAYDAAYLAQGSMRSAALALAAGAAVRVGFDTSGGRALYTLVVPHEDGVHHAERLLRLAAARASERGGSHSADGAPADSRPRLYPGANERERVDALLGPHGVAAGTRCVALAPGSVWATKRWPYYAELAAMLSPRLRVVVLGSAADRELATQIRSRAPAAIDTTGRLSLLESAELIARCAALVSNDSAPVHLGSAMDTPTIAVFGPTVPAFGFGPLATRHDELGHDSLACRPCDRHGPRRCPLGHWRCMRELSPDAVLQSLVRLVPELS